MTRDRREGEAHLGDLDFSVIDTAGLEEAAPETPSGRMQAQTEAAIAAADAIFFMIDARAGLVPGDQMFADVARKAGKPVILIANKSEGRAAAAGAYEAYALGLGEPVTLSAEHGEGLADLYDALREALPEATALSETVEEDVGPRPIRIAVVGRPNSGKSTLINRLLGEERLLTGPEAGITRDSPSRSRCTGTDTTSRSTTPPACGGARDRGKTRKAFGRRCAAGDPLCRRGDPVDGCRQAIRGTGPAHRRSGRAGGRALVIGMNKWDLMELHARRDRQTAGRG